MVIILGLAIAVIYTMGSILDLLFTTIWAPTSGEWDAWTNIFGIDWLDWRLFVVAPIWLLVILISIIAIWIGYSMLTTPAPVPLEAFWLYFIAQSKSWKRSSLPKRSPSKF